MSKAIARYYVDSCPLIYLIEQGTPHHAALEHMMERAAAGDIELVTSTITITEVAFVAVERNYGLQADVLDRIEALWAPGAPIRLVEVTRTIATRARTLLRASVAASKSLKPADAIHVASAMYAEASALYSYDKPLGRYPADIGLTCTQPPDPPATLFNQGLPT